MHFGDVCEFYLKYSKIKILGKGNFSIVELMMNENNSYAVKQIKIKNNLDMIKNEIQFLTDFVDYKNIVKYHESYHDLLNNIVYLVFDYVDGYNISKYIKYINDYDEKVMTALKFLKKILKTIKYIHSKKIVHGDIKPDNIIIRSYDHQPILIDFGFSNYDGSIGVCGTPLYMSPELLTHHKYFFSNDIWSLGITMLECFNIRPWSHINVLEDLINNITQYGITLKISTYNEKLDKLIKLMTLHNHNNRPDAQQLLLLLN